MSCLKRLLYPFVCGKIKDHYLGLNPPQKSTSTTFNSQKPLRFVFIISCKKVELATMLVKSTLLRWTSYQICGLSRFGLVKKATVEQRVKERPPSSSRHALMKKRPPHQGQGEGRDFKILPVHYFLALFTTIPYLHENSVALWHSV